MNEYPKERLAWQAWKNFSLKMKGNILRQKNCKARLSIEGICVRLKSVNCEMMCVRLNQALSAVATLK